jgi:hypothetical protein
MTGVDHLTENDEVVIFYSNNADSITFDILHKLMFCKSKLSYYKIKRGGKNALDFQLSCYLGFRIRKDPEAEFYIISKDNGYDFIVDFWECGYCGVEPNIRRFNTIRTLLQWVEAQKRQKAQSLKTLEKLAVTAAKPEPLTVVADKPVEPKDKPVNGTVAEKINGTTTEKINGTTTEKINGTTESSSPTEEKLPFVPSDEQTEAANELISAAKNSHELYINMVKKFGQKKGRELYHHFKGEFKSR